MDGYKKDSEQDGVFVPNKKISKSKILWSDEDLKNYIAHCDSPSFIENLKRYNSLDRSVKRDNKNKYDVEKTWESNKCS